MKQSIYQSISLQRSDQLSKLIIGMIGNEQKNEVHGNDKPDCVFRETIRECQKKPPDHLPKTSQICLKVMPTLLKELTLAIFLGYK